MITVGTILAWLASLDGGLKVILGLIATLVALYKPMKKVWRGARAFFKKADIALDTLTGRGEIRHPDTGMVIADATLPLHQRLAVIEQQQSDTVQTLKMLAENQQKMIQVEQHLARLQENWDKREKEGLAIISEWEAWRLQHMTFSDKVRDDIDRIKKIVEHIDEKP